ncbi:MAG: carbohydrate ABC transporter substrate-binding protein [Rhodoferax sp.]|nr:carbohydrate ABC transporter substrate-binding protein [Rhodoferax sp.]NCP53686.1 carbohydrate ABC transporter substrate-binding protein [Rhodoferax sp.]PIW06559.1 MAG: sugar ABC transporter substrate-binding protein [Comamonadaceae bacterium CG17_big_fil_post_rev_8_21_14_2_50_60_13]PIY25860.1 MAG: sugar ABC transporter substrate-binding protein [Comamonadaceae bacterium CG_4_10_14_3_um_filter_60_75]PJC13059.1 MAG: sugar ABC transporter substrate-binding protein [Comamonadaceae bacterium CG_
MLKLSKLTIAVAAVSMMAACGKKEEAAPAAAPAPAPAAAPAQSTVEVLHWWTSGGEAKSVAELKRIMQDKGHAWKDFAVAGGGGDNAMTVLKSRVVAGNPPAAAQIKGPAIQEWASEGVLANLDETAKAENWDTLLPGVVADVMKYNGNYVAAPVNVHRVNWMWANKAVLDKAGVKAVPTTWPEFFAAADKVKKAGLIAVAHGGQNWQDFTTFEDVVLGVGGTQFYQDAMVKLDAKALTSPTMTKSLETFRKIKSYTDAASPGRDWNLATAMVIQEKAAFQFMGDWAKGEFTAAGKVPGTDYICAAAPGTANAFTFNVDSFAMFKLKDATAQKAQADLAAAIMGTEFQEVFNLNKGSIPVRLNMDMAKFDDCAKLSSNDFVATAKAGGLVPSIAHEMAVPPAVSGAMKDAVSQFWNDDKMSVADGVKNIAKAAATK